jgi:hypothetical protein
MVSNDRYQIVGESLVKNSQDTVFTLGMATFVANCVLPVIEIKEDGNFGIGSNLSDVCERKTIVS